MPCKRLRNELLELLLEVEGRVWSERTEPLRDALVLPLELDALLLVRPDVLLLEGL